MYLLSLLTAFFTFISFTLAVTPASCSGACNVHDPAVIRRTSDGTYFLVTVFKSPLRPLWLDPGPSSVQLSQQDQSSISMENMTYGHLIFQKLGIITTCITLCPPLVPKTLPSELRGRVPWMWAQSVLV